MMTYYQNPFTGSLMLEMQYNQLSWLKKLFYRKRQSAPPAPYPSPARSAVPGRPFIPSPPVPPPNRIIREGAQPLSSEDSRLRWQALQQEQDRRDEQAFFSNFLLGDTQAVQTNTDDTPSFGGGVFGGAGAGGDYDNSSSPNTGSGYDAGSSPSDYSSPSDNSSSSNSGPSDSGNFWD